jgi:ferredoxin-type protein NapG
MQRRTFVKRILTFLSAIYVSGLVLKKKWIVGRFLKEAEAAANPNKSKKAYLRPPGALPEKEFLSTCINCHRCAQACPSDCIKYINDPLNPVLHDTPYIEPREKACILCMKCTQACPSGSLQPIENDDGETIQEHVKMGMAVVDTNICNSYNGYSCGVCIRACPFTEVALKTETWERPVVTEKCVGCGLCEQSCIHYPQAIRVVPIRD